MAFEHKATPPWSANANSTGLKPRRFVTINASGFAQYPASGAAVAGVTLTGSTGSTKANQAMSILSYGIARVDAAGGALKQGSLCQATSVGRASTAKSAGNLVGMVVAGSTGSTGRVMSVLLQPWGVST